MKNKFNDCLRAKYINVENDGSYAVKRDGEKLTIYFEGSNGLTDWWNNFQFPAKPYRNMENLWFCHRGFLKVWKSIEPYVASDILDVSITTIEVVGYSHGGAMAQLCCEYIKFNRPDVKVTGFGFGSPRVMWGFACKAVMDRFAGFVIVRNGRDIVTHLPPVFLGFRHVTTVTKVGESKGPILDHFPSRYRKALEEADDEIQ